jgi:4-alpha-glucanotransferase
VTDPRDWNIDIGYHDASGTWREPPASTVAAVLQSMGAAGDRHPYEDPATIETIRLDHALPPVPKGFLLLEDGGEVPLDGTLPPDVPVGYHRLRPRDGPERTFVVSPGLCPVRLSHRWGWAAQLYAARSRTSWGIGDLADLARINRWGERVGAELTLLNPLHAAPPGPRQQPSPYFASSRCFSNPIYLRIEDVPGAAEMPEMAGWAEAGRALNADRRIDRDRVWALKSEALELLFARASSRDDGGELDAFLTLRGPALVGFATFNALAEIHGLPWQDWPGELRVPDGAAVAAYASSGAGTARIRYHAWLQLQLDRQLAAAGDARLIADLAIGVDAGGADSWMWQDSFADGMRVGAPPDEFNTLGQDWGLPPWDPWRLRAMDYEPFVQTVRAGLRHAGGLRFDHVMGLFRLFWIPAGAGATDGTYVRYPYWDLLNILALEAHRGDAFVVGEDLGTVQPHVRAELASRRVLSYKLLWFEDDRPAQWSPEALGAVTTHDLPTIAGVWTGADIQAQRDLGLEPNEEGSAAMRARLQDWTGARPAAPVDQVIASAYELLAAAPCRVLTVALDDVAGVSERPNMPGTVDEWPNWSIALPVPLEELEVSPLARVVAASMPVATSMPAGTPGPEPGREEVEADHDLAADGPTPRGGASSGPGARA